jgi:hypothetical protein
MTVKAVTACYRPAAHKDAVPGPRTTTTDVRRLAPDMFSTTTARPRGNEIRSAAPAHSHSLGFSVGMEPVLVTRAELMIKSLICRNQSVHSVSFA